MLFLILHFHLHLEKRQTVHKFDQIKKKKFISDCLIFMHKDLRDRRGQHYATAYGQKT